MRNIQMRNIQRDVARAIIKSQTLMTYKTKAGVGRKSVTVGRYPTATDPSGYAVIIGAEAIEFSGAISAAQGFIKYVGHDDAYNALQGRGRERNPHTAPSPAGHSRATNQHSIGEKHDEGNE